MFARLLRQEEERVGKKKVATHRTATLFLFPFFRPSTIGQLEWLLNRAKNLNANHEAHLSKESNSSC